MDEKTLKRLLRAEGAEAERPGRNCPDEALLSAYVERGIPDEKRATVEAHVADCEACLGQVAFLARQPAEAPAAVMPGPVARARDLVASPPSFWRPLVLRWGPAAAGIACVVLVVVAVLRPGGATQAPATAPAADVVSVPRPLAASRQAPADGITPPAASRQPPADVVVPPAASRQPPAGVTAPPAGSSSPTARRSTSAALTLAVLFPAEAETLARKNLEFRWQAVPGTLYYELTLMTEDGTVVWQTRVEGTSTRLPDGQRLEAGARYFVRVRAHLAGGETIKSAAVSFHLAGQ